MFSLVFDILFYYSKEYVRQVAIDRANQLLDNTVVRISGVMDETEVVTNYMAVVTPQHLHPDSLLAFTRRTVENHDFLTGFAISMEPNYFPDMGRYYSAYSLRQDGTITTVREGPFEYFEKPWYKSSRTLGAPCWVDAYDDYNEGTLSSRDILTSYCCPMRDADGQFVGSITASLTLKWLSEAFTTVHPYPNSSAIMIGSSGVYLVHPDTAKLYRETIFSDAAPESRDDINELGKAMLAGRSGMMNTVVDGNPAYIFYRPLERTGWSIALVCPESDVFARYHRLLYLVWIFIGVGLVFLMLFCYQIIRRAVKPIKLLAEQSQRIAAGHFDESLPHSNRRDSVGRLQNSFIQMERSLASSVAEIRNVNQQLEYRHQELTHAYQLKVEADERKSAFILDMAHQIRTPLNIITGFAQVLTVSYHDFSEEELTDILNRMKSAGIIIHRIVTMLAATSATDTGILPKMSPSTFNCHQMCYEVIRSVMLENPNSIPIEFLPEVPDSQMIHADRRFLMLILSELLNNSCRFTSEGFIQLVVSLEGNTLQFAVADTGMGIPDEKRDTVFAQFTKLNAFSEGVGLGLSLCKRTIVQMGGDIYLDPDYHPGSRFVITLPKQE
jgi:sigma-B regulation protein RsbU (phosphoserine phosphatase)